MTLPNEDFEISASAYQWSGRVVRLLERMLSLRIELDYQPGQIEAGEILLFNHFARFETFIPQYLIYRETGSVCRSLAASDFFVEASPFSRYLRSVGAVPTDHPNLLSFLGEEILRGRKVIIFPEGGMVKDRKVLNRWGRYEAYSRSAGKRRKQHTGAAILALMLDAFKSSLAELYRRGNKDCFRRWVRRLELADEETLLAAVRRPTLIVPSNITFYPIRVGDNLLPRVAELLGRGLNRRLTEELLIEGNILLKDTDMNVRMGESFPARLEWNRWERKLMFQLVQEVGSTEDFFSLALRRMVWRRGLIRWKLTRRAAKVRDEYMHRIYTGVTVHLSHLASQVILTLVHQGKSEVKAELFHKMLYLALKGCQKESNLQLHSSLADPDVYQGLLGSDSTGLKRFIQMAIDMELLEIQEDSYRFLPKLMEEHDFDEIRLENLVSVYANEVAPLQPVIRAVATATQQAASLDERTLANIRFQDELRALQLDRERFNGPEHQQINRQETATENAEPFLIVPEQSRPLGVVLVHGLLASPAEVRQFGERLGEQGYPVLGVRLKGHGTSPWDLRSRGWEEWMESVRRGFQILSPSASRLCLVGFSTGGALSLLMASESPPGLAGVAAVSVPMRLKEWATGFAPLLHGVNKVTRWVTSLEGLKPFFPIEPEHPHINYRHVPVRSVYELQRLVAELEERVARVNCPVLVLQGTEDPVVDPAGCQELQEKMAAGICQLEWIPSSRHGILNENIGGTQEEILSFLSDCQR